MRWLSVAILMLLAACTGENNNVDAEQSVGVQEQLDKTTSWPYEAEGVVFIVDEAGDVDTDHPSWAIGFLATNAEDERDGLGISIDFNEQTVYGPGVELDATDRVIVKLGKPKGEVATEKSYPVMEIRRTK